VALVVEPAANPGPERVPAGHATMDGAARIRSFAVPLSLP
jgi:hypothetical protein